MIPILGTARLAAAHRWTPLAIVAISCFASWLVSGCAVGVGDGTEPSITDIHPLDLEDIDEGKADGTTFNRDRIISDDAFGDTNAITAAEVQAFFERTPYNTRSFLADLRVNGERMSDAVVRVGRATGVNPLLLLATLQKETGLVSRTDPPNSFRIDYAFGCGCPDNGDCSPGLRGIDRQLTCAADALNHPFTAPLRGEPTRAGKYLGDSIRTLDRIVVTPENRATLALYTYTPWVGQASRSGNWLFFNVWKRYVTHVGYTDGLRDPAGETFIGSACEEDDDCGFAGGFCLEQSGGRSCSRRCTGLCPDRTGHPTTFCTELFGDGDGYCLARCDAAAPLCLPGQSCVGTARFEEPSRVEDTCSF